jgi:predicted ATP-dependent serine protease
VIGRERELAVVSEFLDSVPCGSQALLLEGGAGVGKSTVWFEAVRLAEARAYRVLRARPPESEARLSYAASDARRSQLHRRLSAVRSNRSGRAMHVSASGTGLTVVLDSSTDDE